MPAWLPRATGQPGDTCKGGTATPCTPGRRWVLAPRGTVSWRPQLPPPGQAGGARAAPPLAQGPLLRRARALPPHQALAADRPPGPSAEPALSLWEQTRWQPQWAVPGGGVPVSAPVVPMRPSLGDSLPRTATPSALPHPPPVPGAPHPAVQQEPGWVSVSRRTLSSTRVPGAGCGGKCESPKSTHPPPGALDLRVGACVEQGTAGVIRALAGGGPAASETGVLSKGGDRHRDTWGKDHV